MAEDIIGERDRFGSVTLVQFVAGTPRGPTQRRVGPEPGQIDLVALRGEEAWQDLRVQVVGVTALAAAQLAGVAA